MKRSVSNPQAFTLIELLIACAIASGLVALLSLSMHTAFRARASAFAGNQTARAARLTLQAVGRDLTCAMAPTGILAGSFIGQRGSSDAQHPQDQVTFFNLADSLRPCAAAGDIQETTLQLVAPSELQPDPGVAELRLEPDQAPTTSDAISPGWLLVRRVRRQLLNPVKQTPVDQVLCQRVISFGLLYYDGSYWTDSWDSTARSNRLPQAVQVSIEVAGDPQERGESNSIRQSRVFRIPCAEPSSSSSSAHGRWPSLTLPTFAALQP